MAAIGIFDSGVGGLTVLRALHHILPGEPFVYLGDTARLPYGTKSPQTIDRYLCQNIDFLKHKGVKAIVVACNSASSVLGGFQDSEIPIYGVIEPGARAAFATSKRKRIGILGTRATVNSGAYVDALNRLAPGIHTIQQACPLLVPLVEEGLEEDEVTALLLRRYLKAPLENDVDTLILGCTHYPVLKTAIAAIAGHQVDLIDSAESVAHQLRADLANGTIPEHRGVPSTLVWMTDLSPSFREVGQRILGPLSPQSWGLADL